MHAYVHICLWKNLCIWIWKINVMVLPLVRYHNKFQSTRIGEEGERNETRGRNKPKKHYKQKGRKKKLKSTYADTPEHVCTRFSPLTLMCYLFILKSMPSIYSFSAGNSFLFNYERYKYIFGGRNNRHQLKMYKKKGRKSLTL